MARRVDGGGYARSPERSRRTVARGPSASTPLIQPNDGVSYGPGGRVLTGEPVSQRVPAATEQNLAP